MALLIEVHCHGCGYRRKFAERARQYRLPGRRNLFIEQTLAWCPHCQNAVEAESLPELQELEQAVAQAEAAPEWLLENLKSFGRTLEQELDHLRERVGWRLGRKS